MKKCRKIIAMSCAAVFMATILSGCSTEEKKTIKFADAGWDSIQFHNAVAGFIAEKAFDYDSYSQVTGTTPVTHEGTIKGEIDVHMEVWTDNIASYSKDVADGKLREMGINFEDNKQGFYVPRYVIEGDKERNIEAVAPDLKTVEDLKKYSAIFKDAEDKTKGRIYGSIPGWEIDKIMFNKYEYYGLNENYVYFRPGSDAALAAAFTAAYDKGEPIVGYYWEPTWLMGKYDFVLLEDAPYSEADFELGKTECPSVVCTVCTSNDFAKKDPEFCEFLKKYKTSSALVSEALAHMQDTGDDTKATAEWFLKEHDDLLDSWLTADQAAKVREALK